MPISTDPGAISHQSEWETYVPTGSFSLIDWLVEQGFEADAIISLQETLAQRWSETYVALFYPSKVQRVDD